MDERKKLEREIEFSEHLKRAFGDPPFENYYGLLMKLQHLENKEERNAAVIEAQQKKVERLERMLNEMREAETARETKWLRAGIITLGSVVLTLFGVIWAIVKKKIGI